MTDWPILSLVAFLPLAGALFILLLNGTEEAVARNARWAALWTSLVVFVLSRCSTARSALGLESRCLHLPMATERVRAKTTAMSGHAVVDAAVLVGSRIGGALNWPDALVDPERSPSSARWPAACSDRLPALGSAGGV